MASFDGFPTGKTRLVPIPEQFFSELLPQIDNLDELKITLYAFWRLAQSEGTHPYMRQADFLADETLMAGLSAPLEEALAAALARGTLLSAQVTLKRKTVRFYFVNSARGKTAVQAIAQGKWQPSPDQDNPITLDTAPGNIFRLYEEHIGPLTPMIAEALQDAEQEYSTEWIADAIRAAVENNVRKWTYVTAILKGWKKEGKHARTNRGRPEESGKKYTEGEFSDEIEY